jgi:hypothetical protein
MPDGRREAASLRSGVDDAKACGDAAEASSA